MRREFLAAKSAARRWTTTADADTATAAVTSARSAACVSQRFCLFQCLADQRAGFPGWVIRSFAFSSVTITGAHISGWLFSILRLPHFYCVPYSPRYTTTLSRHPGPVNEFPTFSRNFPPNSSANFADRYCADTHSCGAFSALLFRHGRPPTASRTRRTGLAAASPRRPAPAYRSASCDALAGTASRAPRHPRPGREPSLRIAPVNYTGSQWHPIWTHRITMPGRHSLLFYEPCR